MTLVERRSRAVVRVVVAVASTLVLLAAAVDAIVYIHSGSLADRVSAANIVAGDLAVLSLAATLGGIVVTWYRRGVRPERAPDAASPLDAAADRLAELMAGYWQV